jgi:lysophospholipid acyltransferase
VRPFFLDPITGNPTPMKKYYDFATYLVTQLTFSFTTLPFLILTFGDSLRAWANVYFYAFAWTVAAMVFFASPGGKVALKKRLESRQGKASARLKRSISSESLSGVEPILGISKDPEEDIAEAVSEFRAELKKRKTR